VTIRHHPLDDTLAEFAAGTLPIGPSLVLRAHLSVCPDCRRRFRAIQSVGGALLAIESFASVPAGLLERTLAQIDRLERATAPPATRPERPFPGAPDSMRGCSVGRWRVVQPGLRIATVTAPGEASASAMLIRVGAGRRMPRHTHDGVEYTLVLNGEFSDESGLYGPGDYVEGDESLVHQPVAAVAQDCLCLAAIEGRLKMTSLVGQVANSLFGF